MSPSYAIKKPHVLSKTCPDFYKQTYARLNWIIVSVRRNFTGYHTQAEGGNASWHLIVPEAMISFYGETS